MQEILFITLTNVGDVILTLPVLNRLSQVLNQVNFTVLCGYRAAELFKEIPQVKHIIPYEKHKGFVYQMQILQQLQKKRFDVVVDLRNSLFGWLIKAPKKTSPFLRIPKNIMHMSQRHLYKLSALGKEFFTEQESMQSKMPIFSEDDKEYVDKLLGQCQNTLKDILIAFACGSRSSLKRWSSHNYAQLAERLTKKYNARIILIGDQQDIPISAQVKQYSSVEFVDLTACTNLRQTAYLLSRCKVVVTNDSAISHLASYLDLAVVTIFGPTSEQRYGPWSAQSIVVKSQLQCRPCEKPFCPFQSQECLQRITVDEVENAIRKLISN
ncbi:MAG: glycosyltransferase family 9 protein [Candidatus Omnitrophica bacterium]|nr:glycosyltransferase family 9 protein [Candidatus Omnitrophota bacterium]